ncbi:MAG: T9SS type A sorting domain-containing protein [Cytophagales bacterium]|nr:T9SS type A sorting domain-containing protein [Cytophaga sp.]
MKKVSPVLLLLLTSYTMLQAQNSWSDLGLSSDSVITSIVIDKNNNLYAGGRFINVNGYYYIAKWGGTTWGEVGPGKTNLRTSVLAVDSSGNVYTIAKDINSPFYIIKWDGKDWKTVGAPNASGVFSPIAVDKNQNVYTQGYDFDQSNQWFFPWIESGNNTGGYVNLHLNYPIKDITIDNKGNVYAAGGFSAYKEYSTTRNDIPCSVLKNWNVFGSGSGPAGISSIVVDAVGTVYVASNGATKNYVAKWDGTSWTELGSGVTALNANSSINSIALDELGNVYAAGSFVNGNGKKYVAKWNGANWSELGSDKDALNANDVIYKIAVDWIGNVYACGAFTNTAGKKYIAKWNNKGITAGIQNGVDYTAMALYPNPGTDKVFTNIREEGQLNVYTNCGELVVSQKTNAETSFLDLNNISPGMYTISFEGQRIMYKSVKFIKE